MNNKNHVTLTEKNFNRVKKNLSNNLQKQYGIAISLSQIAEAMATSIGFSNFHHAQKEDFKTDKSVFVEPKFQDEYPGIKELMKKFKSNSDYAVFTLLRDRENQNKNCMDFIFNKCLPIKHEIFSDLCNYLYIDLHYKINFDFNLWIETLYENNVIRQLYTGFQSLIQCDEIIAYLEENRKDLLPTFFCRLVDFLNRKIDDNNHFQLISLEGVSIDYITEILSEVENDLMKKTILEKKLKYCLFNFESLNEKERKSLMFLIKIMRKLAILKDDEMLDNIFDYKSVMLLKNKILSVREESDIKDYYKLMLNLYLNSKIKLSGILYKELYFEIKNNMSYLENVNEVNRFVSEIYHKLSSL